MSALRDACVDGIGLLNHLQGLLLALSKSFDMKSVDHAYIFRAIKKNILDPKFKIYMYITKSSLHSKIHNLSNLNNLLSL